MYVEGVSTRKVCESMEVLCGTRFSKSPVSELAGQLDEEVDAWRNRPLTEITSPCLSVDVRNGHMRQGGHVSILIGGVRAVAIADTEGEATEHYLFRDPKARGLERLAKLGN